MKAPLVALLGLGLVLANFFSSPRRAAMVRVLTSSPTPPGTPGVPGQGVWA